jgi:hypothetical protein
MARAKARLLFFIKPNYDCWVVVHAITPELASRI